MLSFDEVSIRLDGLEGAAFPLLSFFSRSLTWPSLAAGTLNLRCSTRSKLAQVSLVLSSTLQEKLLAESPRRNDDSLLDEVVEDSFEEAVVKVKIADEDTT